MGSPHQLQFAETSDFQLQQTIGNGLRNYEPPITVDPTAATVPVRCSFCSTLFNREWEPIATSEHFG
uniref:Uncharacterized protein n=1 Tax=Desertifilum tharense IPPAS B-1220 TaxID=1781255 RepID=A0ACD5H3V0_9CYAN